VNILLQNDHLEITIKHKGAELCSIKNKVTGLQYMWGGDAAVWGKTSPILFPIVGALKEDVFYVENKKYVLPRHGFARDRVFELLEQSDNKIVFVLRSDDASRNVYPFDFQLQVAYTLRQAALHVTYLVINTGEQEMLFSLGAHPAFKVPLVEGTNYEDYFLIFNETESANRWPINNTGLIMNQPASLLVNTNKLQLSKSLFDQDALVLKNIRSNKVSLRSNTHSHGLDFDFDGFPYLGIWAAKHADFVCIEPWCGIADSESHNQQLEQKEGIEKLAIGKSWSRTWKASFF
jgi:galactose mutarotase-like enzyme